MKPARQPTGEIVWSTAQEAVKKPHCYEEKTIPNCHAERSEASAFIRLKTEKCRFLAALGMTRFTWVFKNLGREDNS